MNISTALIHNNIKKYNTTTPPQMLCSTIFNNCILDIKKRRKTNIINYGIHGNYTTKTLEKKISILENSKYTLLFPSGLMALYFIYNTLLSYKNKILIPTNIYSPNINILKIINKKLKTKTIFYNPKWNLFKINKLKHISNIKIIFIETPGSITLETPNITKIVKFAKLKNSIIVMDNTYFGGFSNNIIKHNISYTIQALTKYQNGNNDILLGAINTNNKTNYLTLLKYYKIIGININIHDCNTIIKNLNNLPIRLYLHYKNTKLLLIWLKTQTHVIKKIIHPTYKNCIGHKTFQKYFTHSTGIFSIIFKKTLSLKKIHILIHHLKLFKIGYSWGGSTSLIMIYKINTTYIIRFSIGLEYYQDLITDLSNAFNKVSLK